MYQILYSSTSSDARPARRPTAFSMSASMSLRIVLLIMLHVRSSISLSMLRQLRYMHEHGLRLVVEPRCDSRNYEDCCKDYQLWYWYPHNPELSDDHSLNIVAGLRAVQTTPYMMPLYFPGCPYNPFPERFTSTYPESILARTRRWWKGTRTSWLCNSLQRLLDISLPNKVVFDTMGHFLAIYDSTEGIYNDECLPPDLIGADAGPGNHGCRRWGSQIARHGQIGFDGLFSVTVTNSHMTRIEVSVTGSGEYTKDRTTSGAQEGFCECRILVLPTCLRERRLIISTAQTKKLSRAMVIKRTAIAYISRMCKSFGFRRHTASSCCHWRLLGFYQGQNIQIVSRTHGNAGP